MLNLHTSSPSNTTHTGSCPQSILAYCLLTPKVERGGVFSSPGINMVMEPGGQISARTTESEKHIETTSSGRFIVWLCGHRY